MINFIDEDEFWKAQIAQIEIDKAGEMLIYPQVGKQVIEFGTADNYEVKLKKLKLFFKKILPYKGWNTYTKVNIKYNNQIVCE
jgi:cell division protein FtsQ